MSPKVMGSVVKRNQVLKLVRKILIIEVVGVITFILSRKAHSLIME